MASHATEPSAAVARPGDRARCAARLTAARRDLFALRLRARHSSSVLPSSRNDTICRARDKPPIAQNSEPIGPTLLHVQRRQGRHASSSRLRLRPMATHAAARGQRHARLVAPHAARPPAAAPGVRRALRDESRESLSDRAEPVLLIVILAGIARRALDEHRGRAARRPRLRRRARRLLGLHRGRLYGVFGYFAVGGLLHARRELLGVAGHLPPRAALLAFALRAARAVAVVLAGQARAVRRRRLPLRRLRLGRGGTVFAVISARRSSSGRSRCSWSACARSTAGRWARASAACAVAVACRSLIGVLLSS